MEFHKEINGKEYLIVVNGWAMDDYWAVYDEEGDEAMDYDQIPAGIVEEIEEEMDDKYFEEFGEARREETADYYEAIDYTADHASLERWIHCG